MFSFSFNSGHIGRKFEHCLVVLIHFCIPSNKATENVEGSLKRSLHARFNLMMSDRKTGYTPLNAGKNRGVTNDDIFAYVHTKINVLLSDMSIFSFL